MSDRIPIPDHLDRWTLNVRVTGDTKGEVIRKLLRLAEDIERDPDGHNNGCGGNGTSWRFTEDPEGLTGRDRDAAIREWADAWREARRG